MDKSSRVAFKGVCKNESGKIILLSAVSFSFFQL